MSKGIDILFACDMNESRPWFRDRIPGIKEAIKSVSFKIEMVDIYSLLGEYKYMPTHVDQRKLFLLNENLLKANKNFEKKVISFMPKVLVLGTADNYHEFLMPETVRNIRKQGIYVAGILGDDEFNYPTYRFLLGWFDLFIAYVKPCLIYYERFNLSKGYFFPNSCYLSNKKFDEYNQEIDYDVILVGAPIANRPKMIEALIESGLKIAIFGSKKWENYDFAKNSYYGYIPTEQFDEILSKGKVVLAFLEDHLTGKLHMNTKIWEAVRVARLPISTYYEPLEKDYGLIENQNIVTYKDTSELVEKVSYYVNNDAERLRVAKALYDKVMQEFNYSLMYKKLFIHLIRIKDENSYVIAEDLNVYDFFEKNQKIQYFKSKSSSLDREVINLIKVLDEDNKNKFDYIYFDKIESGKRVISRWPFINFDTIIFLNGKNIKINYFVVFFKSFFLGRALHIHQFCVISKGKTINGRINRVIDRVLNSRLGDLIRRYKKRSK